MTRQTQQISVALCMCLVASTRSVAEPPQRSAQPPPQKNQVGPAPAPKPTVQAGPSATRRAAWRALMLLRGLRALSDIPPAVREELHHHAQRMARLQRIRGLAVQAHDQATLRRVDKLVGREQIRHHDKLARIWPPQAPVATPPAVIEPKPDDAQDDDKPREREGEDDEDTKEGEP